MSKAAKIREALKAVAPGGLTKDQLADKTGIPAAKVPGMMFAFVKRKECRVENDKEGLSRYHINPSYTPGRKSAPPQGKGKKPAGKKKGGRKVRTYRDLANKTNGHRGADGYNKIALDNLVAAGTMLRKAVNDEVEGIDPDSGLAAAIANHDRATKLLEAAGG